MAGTRLSGLISGMDTEGLISQLMEARKTKVTKVKKQQMKQNVKQDTWKELNTKLKNLQSKFVSNMRFESAYAKKTDIPDISGLASKSEIPDVSNFATKSEIPDVSDFATKSEIPSVAGLALEQWVSEQGYLTSHQDISGKADKSELPSKVSDLTNDAGYLTVSDLPDYLTDSDLPDVSAIDRSTA